MARRWLGPHGCRSIGRSAIRKGTLRESPKKLRDEYSIITHYGYCDGSGEYYIVIDSDKCNGCGKCVQICPQQALELQIEFIDLEDKTVAAITEEHRKKIKYTCTSCKPETSQTPCILACRSKAISIVWNPR